MIATHLLMLVALTAQQPAGGIDFTGLGAALSPVAGIIIAVGTVLLNRSKQKVEDVADMEQELELCSSIRGAAMRHIRTLESGYAEFGANPPPRPAELAPGYYRKARAGRHRAGADEAAS